MPRIANRLLIWNAAADLTRICTQQLAKVVEPHQGAEHMLPVNAVRADLWAAALGALSSQQVYRNLGPACEEAPPPDLNKGTVPATGRQTSTDGARQFYWLASKGHLEVVVAAMQDIIAAQDLNVDEIRFDVVETLREVHGPLYWRVFNTGTVGTNAPMVQASSAVLQAAQQFNWLAPGLASFCRNQDEFFILKAFSLGLGRQNIHQMDQIFTALATPRTPVLGLQLALVGLEEEPHVHSLPHDRFSRFAEDACVAMGSPFTTTSPPALAAGCTTMWALTPRHRGCNGPMFLRSPTSSCSGRLAIFSARSTVDYAGWPQFRGPTRLFWPRAGA